MLKEGDKNRLVLEAARRPPTGARRLPKGVGRGIAMADGFGSYTAMVAECSVDAKGAIKVHRVVFAIDSGYVVNPDACRAQAEGNVIFNLGQLYEANTVKDGASSSPTSTISRCRESPRCRRWRPCSPPPAVSGAGTASPGALCVMPAVLNAVFAVTGKRDSLVAAEGWRCLCVNADTSGLSFSV
jgi:CO/xanthine dehydrogenase Mo-binding subunit